jgi:carbonic anhydrase
LSEPGTSSILEKLLAANRHYVEARGGLPDSPVPSERLAIVTCMDVRIDPLPLLGLRLGSAHVLRNAGARVTDDVIRSLVISQQALGTEAVLLLPHTLCGVLGLDPDGLHPRPGVSKADLPHLEFHPMHDLQTSLSEDLRKLRESPWISPHVQIYGLILDVESGSLIVP